MMDRETILQRMDGEIDEGLFKRVRDWLMRDDTRLVAERSATVSVSEASRLWTTRLLNTDVTGQTLHGIEYFLGRLKNLGPRRKLEQFAFVGPDTAANLFFEVGPSHRFVGAVVVDIQKSTIAA
jgi:hypothetical protein